MLPAGTRLEYTAHFDNSVGNEDNPNPGRAVTSGRKTTDEMMIGFITYAETEPRELTIQQVLEEHFGLGDDDSGSEKEGDLGATQ